MNVCSEGHVFKGVRHCKIRQKILHFDDRGEPDEFEYEEALWHGWVVAEEGRDIGGRSSSSMIYGFIEHSNGTMELIPYRYIVFSDTERVRTNYDLDELEKKIHKLEQFADTIQKQLDARLG